MKAIKQIIRYLQMHGELSTPQIAELVDLGLLDWDEAPELHQLPEPAEHRTLRNEVIASDVNEKRLVPQRRFPKKWSRRTRPVDLQEGQLRSALQTYFQNVDSVMRRAVRIAALSDHNVPWQNALIAIRNTSTSKLAHVVASGLDSHAIRWGDIDIFLQEDGYVKIFTMNQLHGPLGTAYRQLLSVPDASHLGRASQLLRYIEVQQLFNFRMAQRQVRQAWELLTKQQPRFAKHFNSPEHKRQFQRSHSCLPSETLANMNTKPQREIRLPCDALQSSQV